MREELQYTIVDLKPRVVVALLIDFALQDAKAQFVVCRMQVYDQPALQARLDPFFHVLDLARGPVTGNDDLLVLIHKGVEGVKELFLRAVLTCDELHVVDHQDINRTEYFLEIHHLAIAQRLHKAIHELFCRQIEDVEVRSSQTQFVSDGMHQVRFTQTHATIQKQRVKRNRPTFSNATRGGMRQFIGFPDNKILKRKARIKWRC